MDKRTQRLYEKAHDALVELADAYGDLRAKIDTQEVLKDLIKIHTRLVSKQ